MISQSKKNDLGLLEYEHPELTKPEIKVYNLSSVINN